ncbi:MAG: SRPBCC family protein [Actinomycetota bacterium]|nr:SRPBCC family protein [Actinomycetota bacterium]MDQ2959362.1 SRPBCC family protein [Actinomycetota bacterium]
MARMRSVREIAADPERVWALATDWTAHGRWIPLTVVSIDLDSPSSSGLGTRFTGRTALGPVGFDDPMTVTGWQPPQDGQPGRCRVVKRGRWLAGWAEIEVSPTETGSRLVWTEDVSPRWTPGVADPLVSLIGGRLFDRTLRKLAAELS